MLGKSKSLCQNFVVDNFEISFFRNCTILGSDMMESQKKLIALEKRELKMGIWTETAGILIIFSYFFESAASAARL